MRALVLVLLLACGGKSDEVEPTAKQFARLLKAGDYTRAHAMLDTKPPITREQFQQQYQQLLKDIGPVVDLHVTTTDEHAYIAIQGRDEGEGIAIIVRDKKIRTIEWGRPD